MSDFQPVLVTDLAENKILLTLIVLDSLLTLVLLWYDFNLNLILLCCKQSFLELLE